MTKHTRVLVTGVTGFVGGAIARSLAKLGVIDCVGSVRMIEPAKKYFCRLVEVGELDQLTDWSSALNGRQVVIHAAARTHIMKGRGGKPQAEYHKVNVDGTLNLARQAASAGVKRFIFISSIKVNGEQTSLGKPFTADDMPAPEDAYGMSKLEAEQGLQALAIQTGMEVVIIRPPLVYGPGVKGNFASMVRLVKKGVPLPLGSVNNQRTLVALDNLVDLILTCINHPAAANQVFLAGDGQDLSTTELLSGVAKAIGKPSRLVPVPAGLLMTGAKLLNKKSVVQRLLGSLQVDITKAREILGWNPPISVNEGLKRCVTDA